MHHGAIAEVADSVFALIPLVEEKQRPTPKFWDPWPSMKNQKQHCLWQVQCVRWQKNQCGASRFPIHQRVSRPVPWAPSLRAWVAAYQFEASLMEEEDAALDRVLVSTKGELTAEQASTHGLARV